MNIILASGSPRRRELLAQAGFEFKVEVSNADENVIEESPEQMVEELAARKAEAVVRLHNKAEDNCLVIGADTIVVDGTEILGKPLDQMDAARILEQLRGNTHKVLSGIALYNLTTGDIQTRLVCTEVKMREYTEDEIQEYIASGDPLDKAGAYGIQNRAFNPAPEFSGCFANVMGLPLCHLAVLMKDVGIDLDHQVAERCQNSIKYKCPVYAEILAGMKDNSTESKLS